MAVLVLEISYMRRANVKSSLFLPAQAMQDRAGMIAKYFCIYIIEVVMYVLDALVLLYCRIRYDKYEHYFRVECTEYGTCEKAVLRC